MDATGDGSGAAPIGYAGPVPAGPAEVPNAPPGRVDWAVIAVRLAAIWCLANGLPLVLGLPLLFAGDDALPWSYRLSTLAPSGLSLGFGIVLWASAHALARRMLADVPPAAAASPSEPPHSRMSVADVQAVCFSVVGVVLAALAVRHLPLVFPALNDSNGAYERTGVDRGYMFRFLAEAATGAGLFFGARGLSNLWLRVRSGPDGGAGTGNEVRAVDDPSGQPGTPGPTRP